MSKRKYFLRQEAFGYTFFDKKTLRYNFIFKNDLSRFFLTKGIGKNDCEYLPASKKKFRKDIVYSPIRIYYELTLACNLHCRHCFNSSGKKRPDELNTEEVLKSLYNLKESNVMDIRFTGGEPLCHPDWYKIFKKAKDLGFAVSVNTNATYSDAGIYSKLASLNLEQVTISIDGNKNSHERNRGVGSFDKTIRTLMELHRLGTEIRINTLVDKESVKDLEFMAELASKYASEINFFIVRFIGRGANLEFEDSVNMNEFYQMAKEAERIRKKFPRLRLLHFAQVTHERSIRQETHDKFGLRIGPPSGFSTFNISSDGGLWAGGYTPYIDPNWCFGNIKTSDIFNVWQNNDKLEEYRDIAGRLRTFCVNCPEYGRKCPGPNYEIELYRQLHPESRNFYCIYGDGPSLLTKLK